MSVNWTQEQQQVIELRDRNILVSAAAGSGKTAVLVERIITRLTKDCPPLHMNQLLSVTFTKAAAAEMKERILDAIERALEVEPDNQHLQQQATLIHNAKITTIHSFCLDVIGEYFHVIDLDPNFRIAEEGELQLLKQEVMDALLEQEYEQERTAFIQFIESVAPGKKDKIVEELILDLYHASQSNPRPSLWLEKCKEPYKVHSVEELEETFCAKCIVEEVHHILPDVKSILEKALEICNQEGGPLGYSGTLELDLQRVVEIEEKHSLQALELFFSGSSIWTTLKGISKKDKESGAIDLDLMEQVKSLRAFAKKPIDDFKKTYFSTSLEHQVKILGLCCPVVEELLYLVGVFDNMYGEKKTTKNLIEFNDMEHFALKILTQEEDGVLVPSPVAKEYQRQFAEIMIDEYQDSNEVQETILRSVSGVSQGINNLFMVGDVKQSIYGFRSAKPELFMEKFHTYSILDSSEQRIDLFKNFRSRMEVLDGTNYIFEKIMQKSLGGVDYDQKAALYLGANYDHQDGNEMEVRLLDGSVVKAYNQEVQEGIGSPQELEIKDVAYRIQELVGSHRILDKETKTYREANYGDIVILTRSMTNWPMITEVMGKVGIPVHTESREGYFSAWEIALLLDYLRVIDNPRQDLPLTAVLISNGFGKVTDKELAMIRGRYPGWKFHEAVYAYAYSKEDKSGEAVLHGTKNETQEKIEEAKEKIEKLQEKIEEAQEKELREKLQRCLDQIYSYRKEVSYSPIHELLGKILEETGYEHYVYARPEGIQRKANLQMLLEKAMVFEGTSYKGLFNFIRYIEQLQKYRIEMGEANTSGGVENVVRVMTIHKSKGLEFPIVFLMNMGKKFNMRDASSLITQHMDLGIGMDGIDLSQRVKYKSVLKHVIGNQIRRDARGEELRVLYVAMTRAKEKLILTGVVDNLEKSLEQIKEQNMDVPVLGYLQLNKAQSYLDWILPCIAYHSGFDSLWTSRGMDIHLTHPFRKTTMPLVVKEVLLETLITQEVEAIAEDMKQVIELDDSKEMRDYRNCYYPKMEEQIYFQYAYEREKAFKLKVTVTELKKHGALAEEAGEVLYGELEETGEVLYEVGTEDKVVNPDSLDRQCETRKVQAMKIPKFIQKAQEKEGQVNPRGVFRGTAYHRLLELWDFTTVYEGDPEYEVEKVRLEMNRLVLAHKLEEEMEKVIDPKEVLGFLKSPLGNRMTKAAKAGQLYKEQPFVLKVSGREIYQIETQEITLIQGIIDVYFIEDEKIVLLDYKTDRVKDIGELKAKYATQLEYYGQAIEQLRGLPVKEKLIYSFYCKEVCNIAKNIDSSPVETL